MSNKIENVVIVAGGLNTRMEDLSVFPKVLFPLVSSDSILTHDLEVFVDKDVYLVINEKYYDMVLEYCSRNMLAVRVIKSSNTDGSANTLKEVSEMLPSSNTLLVWSDLIIQDANLLERLLETSDKKHIVLTQAGMYRFKANEIDGRFHLMQIDNNQLGDFYVCGNVPGIYFYQTIPDFSMIPEDKHNYDYVEFINDFYSQYIDACPVGSNLIEFRDKEKFKEYYLDKSDCQDTSKKTRFFNTLKWDRDTMKVTKSCENPEYTHLIKREGKWYDTVERFHFDGIPTVYRQSYWEDNSFASITMEILDGFVTANEYSKSHTQKEIADMIDRVIKKAEELHSKDSINVEFVDVQEDYEEEFIEKVLRRCDSIKHILINYDRKKLEKLLTDACSILYHHKCKIGVMPNTTYSLIHGDLNGSNVMYNPETKEAKFIDPRGYFGKTSMYGPEEYDFAKILYFISGYDRFNQGRAIYNEWVQNDILDTYNIPQCLMRWELWIMVGIIWIALAQYIAQDVMKANIAYEYGMKILEEHLTNKDNESATK